MEMAFNNGLLLTGARDGIALAWDLETGQPHRLNSGEHRGQISSLYAFADSHFASGDQAGYVRMWDLRTRGARAASACVHPGGAVSEIKIAGDSVLVTAGADKRLVVTDLRRMDQPLHILEHHKDFIYSLAVTDQVVLSGAGDGMLLVHDLVKGKLRYGLGANAAGIRSILTADSFIVASGDDGNGMLYHYG
jgi:F-box/WD-40 domain protein 7